MTYQQNQTPEPLASNTREFKYLVGFNRKTKQFKTGFTRPWKFHMDIHLGEDFKPFSGGWLKVDIDANHNWLVDTMVLFGKSEGFNVSPAHRDLNMMKAQFRGEDEGELVNLFDKDGNPVKEKV